MHVYCTRIKKRPTNSSIMDVQKKKHVFCQKKTCTTCYLDILSEQKQITCLRWNPCFIHIRERTSESSRAHTVSVYMMKTVCTAVEIVQIKIHELILHFNCGCDESQSESVHIYASNLWSNIVSIIMSFHPFHYIFHFCLIVCLSIHIRTRTRRLSLSLLCILLVVSVHGLFN